MPYNTARAAIDARFLAAWTAAAPTLRTPVRFGEARVWQTRTDLTLPLLEQPPPATSWCWLTVRFGTGLVAEMAPDPHVRVQGLIDCSFFCQRGRGSGVLEALADLAVPIFERRQFSGVQVYERQGGGPIADPALDGRLLRFPFEFDDVSPDA